MTYKQNLQDNIRELLEISNIFSHIKIRGKIDREGENLSIEYKKAVNVTSRNFNFSKNILEERVKTVVEKYFFPRISFTFEGPDEKNIYRINFTKHSSDNLLLNSTSDLLIKLREYLGNKYIFKN